MASQFPSIVATLTYPNANAKLNVPSHSSIHGAVNDEIIQIETVIGTSSSTIGTIIGDLRNPLSGGGGHIQTAALGGTGQTSFTKGDLLVGQSSSVLSKFAVSSVNGYSLVSDSTQQTGLNWRVTAPLDYQVFTATGTWNKPSVLSGNEITHIQMWGAGGPGAVGTQAGGGGGGFAEFSVPTSILSSSVLVTVAPSVAAGSVAGNTTFSSYTAYGGGKGSGTTGGGGGGLLGSGSSPNGGSPVGGLTASDSNFGGGGGASVTGNGGNSAYGGGGGAAGNSASSGGNSAYGGGGGAAGGGGGTGGTSEYAGNGGGNGAAGAAPGGGGGNGAAGARGEARIWTV